jgi:hypothetical protein
MPGGLHRKAMQASRCKTASRYASCVVAGLDPAIHPQEPWMRGSSPRMTIGERKAPERSGAFVF